MQPVPKESWVTTGSNCLVCRKSYGVFGAKKKNCPFCGRLLCNDCVNAQITIMQGHAQEKVCLDCFTKIQNQRQKQHQAAIGSSSRSFAPDAAAAAVSNGSIASPPSSSSPPPTTTMSAQVNQVAPSAAAPAVVDYRRKMQILYLHYVPEKYSAIEATLAKYKGSEDALIEAVVKKYGPEPTGEALRLVEEKLAQREPQIDPEIRRRVRAMYEHYAPTKLATVEATLEKYKTNGTALIDALIEKYGPEPAAGAPALASSSDGATASTAAPPPSTTAPPPSSVAPPPSSAAPSPTTDPVVPVVASQPAPNPREPSAPNVAPIPPAPHDTTTAVPAPVAAPAPSCVTSPNDAEQHPAASGDSANRIEAIESLLAVLQERSHALRHDNDVWMKRAEELETTVSSSMDERKRLLDQLEAAKGELEDAKANAAAMSRDANTYQAQFVAAQASIASMEEALLQKEAARSAAVAEAAALKSHHADLQNRFDALNQAYQEAQQSFGESDTRLKSELESLRTAQLALESHNAELKARVDAMLTASNATAAEQAKALGEEAKLLEAKKAAVEDAARLLEQNRKEIEDERQRLAATKQMLSDESSKTQISIQRKEETLSEMTKRLEADREGLAAQQAAVAAKEKEVTLMLSAGQQQQEALLKEREADIGKRSDELEAAKKSFEEQQAEQVRQTAAAREEAAKALAVSQALLDEDRKALAAERDAFASERERHAAELKEMERSLAVREANVASDAANIQKLRDQIAADQLSISANSEAASAALTVRQAELEARALKLDESHAELAARRKELDQRAQDLVSSEENRSSHHASTNAALDAKALVLEKAQRELADELESVKLEREVAAAKLAEKEKELAKIKEVVLAERATIYSDRFSHMVEAEATHRGTVDREEAVQSDSIKVAAARDKTAIERKLHLASVQGTLSRESELQLLVQQLEAEQTTDRKCVESLSNELQLTKQQLSVEKETVSTLTSKAEMLAQEVDATRAQMTEDNQAKLNHAQEEHAKVVALLDNAMQEQSRLEVTVQAHVKEIEALNVSLQQQHQLLAKAQAELLADKEQASTREASLRELCTQLESDNARLQEDKVALSTSVEQGRDARETLLAEKEAAVATRLKECEAAYHKDTQVIAEKERALKDREVALLRSMDELDVEKRRLHDAMQALENDRQVHNAKEELMQQDLIKREQKLEEDRTVLAAATTQLETERGILAVDHQRAVEALAAREETLSEMTKKVEADREGLVAQQAAVAAKEKEVTLMLSAGQQQQEALLKEREADIGKRSDELEAAKKSFEEQQAEQVRQTAAAREEAAKALAASQALLDEDRKALAAERDAFASERERHAAELKEMERSLAVREATIASDAANIQKLRDQLDVERSDLQSAQRLFEEQQAAQTATLSDKQRDVEALGLQLEQKRAEVAASAAKLKAKEKEFDTTCRKAEEDLAKQRKSFEEERKAHEEAVAKQEASLKSSLKKAATKEELAKSREEKAAELERSVASKLTTLEAKAEALQRDQDELKKRKEEHSAAMKLLQAEKLEATTSRLQLDKDKDELSTTMKRWVEERQQKEEELRQAAVKQREALLFGGEGGNAGGGGCRWDRASPLIPSLSKALSSRLNTDWAALFIAGLNNLLSPTEAKDLLAEGWSANVLRFEQSHQVGGSGEESPMRSVLIPIAVEVATQWNLIDTLVPRAEFVAFVGAVELLYNDVPYHNRFHAADVLRAAFQLIQGSPKALLSNMSATERLAVIVAALGHDVRHPGCSNSYLRSTLDTATIIPFGGKAPLEHLHCQTIFLLLSKKQYDFTTLMDDASASELHSLVASFVLSTDMSIHASQLSQIADSLVMNSESMDGPHWKPVKMKDHRRELLSFFVHAADLSSTMNALPIAKQWGARITQEFSNERDNEVAQQLRGKFWGPAIMTNYFSPPKGTPAEGLQGDELMAFRHVEFSDAIVAPVARLLATIFRQGNPKLADEILRNVSQIRADVAQTRQSEELPSIIPLVNICTRERRLATSVAKLEEELKGLSVRLEAAERDRDNAVSKAEKEISGLAKDRESAEASKRSAEALWAKLNEKEAMLSGLDKKLEDLEKRELDLKELHAKVTEIQVRNEYGGILPHEKEKLQQAAAVIASRELRVRELEGQTAHQALRLEAAQRDVDEKLRSIAATEETFRKQMARLVNLDERERRLAASEEAFMRLKASVDHSNSRSLHLSELEDRLNVRMEEASHMLEIARTTAVRLNREMMRHQDRLEDLRVVRDCENKVAQAIAESRDRRRVAAQGYVVAHSGGPLRPVDKLERAVYQLTSTLSMYSK